ncbi:MAG: regulator of sigma protease [Chloroflexota bacterium]|jgi:regulator of sigma E protease|nr:regulator of sigma protease [Chloroflexota bacterium]
MSGLLGFVSTVVLFVVVLGSLVLIHELGHFVMARLAGIRVLEFGIGFPPRARVLRSSGETLYTLNWLPIGGFVKLEGEDGDETDDPRSFARARLPVKVIILVAGVVMNLLLSLVIFTSIAWLAAPVVGVTIPVVEPGSPAEAAGLKANDAIVSVNGIRHDIFSLATGDVIEDLRDRVGQTVTLQVIHPGGQRADIPVTLRTADQMKDPDGAGPLKAKGALGISVIDPKIGWPSFFPGEYLQRDLPTAIGVGANETTRWFGVILGGLGDLGRQIVTNPTAAPPVSGPIGIATQISDIFFGAGIVMTLYVAGILSANLALVNILPFPPLDGGRVLMLVLKRVFGARISLRAEQMTYFVGFVFLFAFLIWVSGFDIVRILSGGS